MHSASVDTTCPRCLQATPPGAGRCPHCGDRLPGSTRNIMLIVGVLGALFIAAVIGLALFLQPTMEDPDAPPQEKPPAAAPGKKPPLN